MTVQRSSGCKDHSRYGNVEMSFTSTEEKGPTIEIVTQRLRIISVNTRDYLPQLVALYGDSKVNEKVGNGSTLSQQAVCEKVDRWISRWSEGNPFSGYVVLKKETDEFVGQIILKPVKDKSKIEKCFIPEVVEIGYLTVEKEWGQGFGKEFTHAMVNHFIPSLIQKGVYLQGSPIKKVMATTREDNTASNHVLAKFMQFVGSKPRYGSPRNWYEHLYKL